MDEAYRDQAKWTRMSIMATAGSAFFSSDRTIQQYANEIWHVTPCQVRRMHRIQLLQLISPTTDAKRDVQTGSLCSHAGAEQLVSCAGSSLGRSRPNLDSMGRVEPRVRQICRAQSLWFYDIHGGVSIDLDHRAFAFLYTTRYNVRAPLNSMHFRIKPCSAILVSIRVHSTSMPVCKMIVHGA